MYSSKSPVACTGLAACLPATGMDTALVLFWFFTALAIAMLGLTLVRLSRSRPSVAMIGTARRNKRR